MHRPPARSNLLTCYDLGRQTRPSSEISVMTLRLCIASSEVSLGGIKETEKFARA